MIYSTKNVRNVCYVLVSLCWTTHIFISLKSLTRVCGENALNRLYTFVVGFIGCVSCSFCLSFSFTYWPHPLIFRSYQIHLLKLIFVVCFRCCFVCICGNMYNVHKMCVGHIHTLCLISSLASILKGSEIRMRNNEEGNEGAKSDQKLKHYTIPLKI